MAFSLQAAIALQVTVCFLGDFILVIACVFVIVFTVDIRVFNSTTIDPVAATGKTWSCKDFSYGI